MKPHERRRLGKTTYYKLAVWDDKNISFRDGKRAYDDYEFAILTAVLPGKYRISEVTEEGRKDFPPFEVE